MIKLDLVLQGPVSSVTGEIIEQYSKLEFVNNIILSSYRQQNFLIPDKVIFVENNLMANPGLKNRNHQINTTRNGLKFVTTQHCVKLRTDQIIPVHSMYKLYDFWLSSRRTVTGRGFVTPQENIYVLGMYKKHVYHPRDHVFWGNTEDIKNFFSIPFDCKNNQIEDYNRYTRTETYIGQFYYARLEPTIYNHILNPTEYLVDNAPKKQEALKLDYELRDTLFKVFPRIDMSWPKYGLQKYHYAIVSLNETEYWHD